MMEAVLWSPNLSAMTRKMKRISQGEREQMVANGTNLSDLEKKSITSTFSTIIKSESGTQSFWL